MFTTFRLAIAMTLGLGLGLGLVACGGAATATDSTGSTTQTGSTPSTGTFTLSSSAFVEGGAFPAVYTCDGAKSTPPLSWANAPSGTKAFVLLMTTQPDTTSTKWNWVLYDIPAGTTALATNTSGVGTLGQADDGAGEAYAAPCSQGPGAKTYTFTLYALSALPTLSATASANTGAVVTAAVAALKLGSAALNVTATRTTGASGTAAVNCALIQASVANYASAGVSVDCSAGDYGRLASTGLASHAMMTGNDGLSNLQVPLAQAFSGDNAWKIPLTPAIAATTTSVVDGPIGIAVNGVPIFNPCKQGGCTTSEPGYVLGDKSMDSCNGHAGRADDYHYHAAPTCMMADQAASYWNTNPIGWALDGFAIFGYNNPDGSTPTRDAVCGGSTLAMPNAPAGYSYHVTDVSPYFMSCLRGTPSPDLAGQGAKYKPLRVPPVTPFALTRTTLSTGADGYQVMEITSSSSFTATETGSDSYSYAPGTYRIRYKQVVGTDLTALLALGANSGKTACWSFQFTDTTGASTQPSISYCR